MEISQLEGKRVKISANTITVKDDRMKTAGLIQNVRRIKLLPIRDVFTFSEYMKKHGLNSRTICTLEFFRREDDRDAYFALTSTSYDDPAFNWQYSPEQLATHRQEVSAVSAIMPVVAVNGL